MNKTFRIGAIGALVALALGGGAPAFADTLVYESAGFVPNGEVGDYPIYPFSSANGGPGYVATTFTLGQQTNVTGVGGVFTQFPVTGGSIFADIIAAPANQTDVTATSLVSQSLGHVVFTAPTDGSDAKESLNVLLGPGTYELVFGSGLFGATGDSGLASGMQGTANFFNTADGGQTWNAQSDSLRMTVYASPVPLPAGLPLLISGVAALGGLLRRKTNAGAAV